MHAFFVRASCSVGRNTSNRKVGCSKQGNHQVPCSSQRQKGGARPFHLEELADHACALARVLLQGQAAGRQGGACRGQ